MTDLSTPSSTAPAAASGAISLVRHGEPALSRKCRLTAKGYREFWAAYEIGGILPGQTPPPALIEAARAAGTVYASTRRRAIETATAVVGSDGFTSEILFVEAPLPPPAFPEFIRLSPKVWGFLARFWWWFFDHHDAGEERRAAAETRAKAAALALISRAEHGRDVMVFAHGFFNQMVAVELKRMGWRMTLDQGFRYWSRKRFEKR